MCPVNAEVRVPFRAVQWDLEPVYDFSALAELRMSDLGGGFPGLGFWRLASPVPLTSLIYKELRKCLGDLLTCTARSKGNHKRLRSSLK